MLIHLLPDQEIEVIIAEERLLWLAKQKPIARVELRLDGDEITVIATERSPIRRVPRITGYLSNVENSNDAKRDEVNARFKHVGRLRME
ncbi:hypothetical protein [Anaerospora hongkongensis]|uniref:hypothetical protein n=1 Tax=Anaerospora hongkongensis TaxID=244830 RepID=UPI00289E5779|nr:hypothetical protein [Anaerospora hongkongensis]